MNVVDIAQKFIDDEITLKEAYDKLDALGYTDQEIQRVIKGAFKMRDRIDTRIIISL